MRYRKNSTLLRFCAPSTKFALLGAVLLGLGLVAVCFCTMIAEIPHSDYLVQIGFAAALGRVFSVIAWILLGFGAISLLVALIMRATVKDSAQIRILVRRALFDPAYGNPLHFQDGELLPAVVCNSAGSGRYQVIVQTGAATAEQLSAAISSVSAALVKKFKQFAVSSFEVELAVKSVVFEIENMTLDKSLHVYSADELRPQSPTKLQVQIGTWIDLETSGSMLVSGKTRSGKTTGIISLLLQVLQWRADKFGSQVTIVDPKRAELSRLPGVVTVDEDGGGRAILAAMREFAAVITQRQDVLNRLSETQGDAVKWWDAHMHSSFLFLDEFVTARTLFPAKADKSDSGYCLAEFDSLLKRIVTMGASAGCFVIISIAEASVQEGGLPSMLRSAMSTKILFRPTLPEGRLLWDGAKLEALNANRTYLPGDAWFSSTDGEHDNVSCVHFPVMDFPVYRELGRLLSEYYCD